MTLWFLIGGLILALLGTLIWVCVRLGGVQIERDFYEASNDKAKQALEIDERVKSMSDDERRKWLYGDK